MAEHTLTVSVPPVLYDELKHRADRMQRSIEDEVILTLAATLASLAALDDATLYRLAASRVADADAARLEELGDKRQRGGLSDAELRETEELIERHDRVLVVRAEAAALLTQRGGDVPSWQC